MTAPLPDKELERLHELYAYKILDTAPEPDFDNLSHLAAYICGTPISLIGLIDEKRQWFKAKVGVELVETTRDIAFCAHTILQSDVLVVPDLLADQRFANHPLVAAEPHVRFYAGSPLITSNGHAVGSLCVIDLQPRELSDEQIKALRILGRLVVKQLELRNNLTVLGRITELRKRTEETLRQTKERFRNLVEQINDWVWEIDLSAAFSYVSPKVSQILGYEPKEVIGKTLENFMADDEAKRHNTVMHYFMTQQEPFSSLENQLIHQDGRLIDCESSGSPILDVQGKLQGYRGVTRNITERKQAEREMRKALTQEKELNDLKSLFINTASHEFRTPLTTILAAAESLEHYGHKWTDEKKQAYFRRIQTAVDYLNRLLQDVLFLGRSDAKKVEFQASPLDLEKFCRHLVEDLQLTVGSKHQINFLANYPSQEAVMDEKLLQHILINLLSNALKYSPEGGEVTFALSHAADTAIFQIQDAGIGIPAPDLKKLFASFYRATNVGNISGTGLGLSIVKRAVDSHGGNITVTSTVGKGTTFTVTLPTHHD
ncbi:PAS domain S-box protein [Phormidium sp. FACHB-592]|uniref:histidine kinase n=1 Tax=Stenomitos frigidus AS-A4 TaxID=2933935 RepID=A0ABV0KQG0_9CYAN|nr:ATP-binding protein [Phormidium sp. FACHB-592]MBD2072535.1 PAS domain S-box protein [Phormidium sp. FACHB-592]